MRLKLIACKVLFREISLLASQSTNIIDTTFLRQGLHNTPERLRAILQAEIDRLDAQDDLYSFTAEDDENDFDAILLGYGLCSNAIVGLHSKRYRLVIPRAHDCVSFLLGSKDTYKKIFDAGSGGIYWYSVGWNENAVMPSRRRVDRLRAEYEEKYGEDNAEYLMEMEQAWMQEYKTCLYIDWAGLHSQEQIDFTKDAATHLGWTYRQHAGDDALLRDFLSGEWDTERFLVVPPGDAVAQSYDETVICVDKA